MTGHVTMGPLSKVGRERLDPRVHCKFSKHYVNKELTLNQMQMGGKKARRDTVLMETSYGSPEIK